MSPSKIWCLVVDANYKTAGSTFGIRPSIAEYPVNDIDDLRNEIKRIKALPLDADQLVVLRRAESVRVASLEGLNSEEIGKQVQDAERLKPETELDSLQLEELEKLLVLMPASGIEGKRISPSQPESWVRQSKSAPAMTSTNDMDIDGTTNVRISNSLKEGADLDAHFPVDEPEHSQFQPSLVPPIQGSLEGNVNSWHPLNKGFELEDHDSSWATFNKIWTERIDDEIAAGEVTDLNFMIKDTTGNVLIRHCYKELFDKLYSARGVESGAPGWMNGAVVTGQPGTGKTTWLYFAAARLLSKGESFFFYTETRLYLFYEKGVFSSPDVKVKLPEPHQVGTAKTCWFCLLDLDANESVDAVEALIQSRITFPVIAISPKKLRYKRFTKEKFVKTLYMPLWTERELIAGMDSQAWYKKFRDTVTGSVKRALRDIKGAICCESALSPDVKIELGEDVEVRVCKAVRALLQANDPNMLKCIEDSDKAYVDYDGKLTSIVDVDAVMKEMLSRAVFFWGRSARDFYKGVAWPPDSAIAVDGTVANLRYNELLDMVGKLDIEALADASTVSHQLFVLVVEPKSESNFPERSESSASVPRIGGKDNVRFDFKSPWIAEKVLRRIEGAEIEEIAKNMMLMGDAPCTASLRGHIYERITIRKLGKAGGPYSLCRLVIQKSAANTLMTFAAEGGAVTWNPGSRNVTWSYLCPQEIDSRDIVANLWVPYMTNNPLFDAFLFDVDESQTNATIWILQMTISEEHHGSKAGYKKIAEIAERVKDLLSQRNEFPEAEQGMSPTGDGCPKTEIKYVLINPHESAKSKWHLRKENWSQVQGDVFHLKLAI